MVCTKQQGPHIACATEEIFSRPGLVCALQKGAGNNLSLVSYMLLLIRSLEGSLLSGQFHLSVVRGNNWGCMGLLVAKDTT